MKKRRIRTVSIVMLLIAVLTVFSGCRPQEKDTPKDLRTVVNKNLPLSEGITYCDGIAPDAFQDDFSRIYSQAVKMNVTSIDETNMVATVTLAAPPLKDILQSCLPDNDSVNYDEAVDAYMSDVYEAIKNCPEADLVSTTVECKLVEKDGLKILPNQDFTEALFPNVQQLLAELLLEGLNAQEVSA